jgi:orotate phosphoribosyltransferase
MHEVHQRLIRLFRDKSLCIGQFKLTSGLNSNYYFDAKRTTLDAEGAYLCAKLILEAMKQEGIQADAIGGLTLGADPVVAAVSAVSFAERKLYKPISAFIVRKEPKTHGTEVYIEGFQGPPGSPVVIVDDVCTTGSSTRNAIQRVEKAGYRVVSVIALVDREQGGKETLRDYPFLPLLTASELLGDPEIQGKLAEVASAGEPESSSQ